MLGKYVETKKGPKEALTETELAEILEIGNQMRIILTTFCTQTAESPKNIIQTVVRIVLILKKVSQLCRSFGNKKHRDPKTPEN